MSEAKADFTNTFRALCDAASGDAADAQVRATLGEGWDGWASRWRARLAEEPGIDHRAAMRAVNPWVIPRNHRVEEALAAAHRGDMAPFDALAAVLARPFDEDGADPAFANPPAPDERVLATFCGT